MAQFIWSVIDIISGTVALSVIVGVIAGAVLP